MLGGLWASDNQCSHSSSNTGERKERGAISLPAPSFVRTALCPIQPIPSHSFAHKQSAAPPGTASKMLASILASYVTKKQSLFSDPLPRSSPRLDARAIARSQCHVLGLDFFRLLERSLTLLA